MSVILLVLDGLGIGEMPDVERVRPQDRGANTLRSLVQSAPHLHLDNLLRLGLGKAACLDSWGDLFATPLASFGRNRLAHNGADSYLGHQEIMGTIPKIPELALMSQVASLLENELRAAGYTVRRPLEGKDLLLVNETVTIGDNLEADPGLNINLTVPTDLIRFEDAARIGRIVRGLVNVARVIVFGGPGIDVADMLNCVEVRDNGQIGVASPCLGVYNEHLYVQHLGYGVDPDQQAASIVMRHGVPVALIGKMADLIVCPGALKNPVVPTPQVMEAVLRSYQSTENIFIAATVQETDLSAHEGDIGKLSRVLEQVDSGLVTLLGSLLESDVLIICADHGNDPHVNVGRHTREETPLLIYQKGQAAVSLGTRTTLADIGATVTHLFHAPPTQDGTVINYRRNT